MRAMAMSNRSKTSMLSQHTLTARLVDRFERPISVRCRAVSGPDARTAKSHNGDRIFSKASSDMWNSLLHRYSCAPPVFLCRYLQARPWAAALRQSNKDNELKRLM